MRRIIIPGVRGGAYWVNTGVYGQETPAHQVEVETEEKQRFDFDPDPLYKVKRLTTWPLASSGWTVFTYKDPGYGMPLPFVLQDEAVIEADVLLVGGGGSGGGGYQGGGGGAGGFIDLHGVTIIHRGDPYTPGPYETVLGDGDVFVGTGGQACAFRGLPGVLQQGENTVFGDKIAYGGGYGSSQWAQTWTGTEYLPEPDVYYHANDGGSGGGAGPWPLTGEASVPWDVEPWASTDDWTYIPYGRWHGHGVKGQAIHNEGEGLIGPFDPWQQMWNYETTLPYGPQPQGHDGGQGDGYTSWAERSAGGGGGANWYAYGTGGWYTGVAGMNGGLGRPCDIGGWYQGPPPIGGTQHELWKAAGWKYIPWFSGGGAGKERPNNWSYPDGFGGYGGGANCGVSGAPHTGGGGGGGGSLTTGTGGPGNGRGDGAASNGGSGIVIIRIKNEDVRLVAEPQPISWVAGIPVYPDHITVTYVPPDEPHIDEHGGEPVIAWAEPPKPYCHYGYDGEWGT